MNYNGITCSKVVSKNILISKEDVPKLRYGVIHSQVGFNDGVSIVINQLEKVMIEKLKISKKNIFYLVGKSGAKDSRISTEDVFWDRNKANQFAVSHYEKGYGGGSSEKIELAVTLAKKEIEEWIIRNNIDVIFVHNSSHPVNFVYSIALSRYYRDSIAHKKKTPKYILWWHDSHLERAHFSKPAADTQKYLLEGVPGRFVEYIVFINNLQFDFAKNYFLRIDKRYPGFYNRIICNYNVAPNTTDTFINSYSDIQRNGNGKKVEKFIEDFKVNNLLKKENLKRTDVIWCLQHTRILKRKRIDFALKYCYNLLEKSKKKALYFLISGQSVANDSSRKSLINLNNKLRKLTGEKVFLVFAEDYYSKTDLSFGDYPIVFAKLGGFSTYFSEVEGFGNNLLEVLANGLIPVVYKYLVFRKDIEKYGFNLISLDDFDVTERSLEEVLSFLKSPRKRALMVNKNIKILRKNFPHNILASKIFDSIVGKRLHS